MKHGEFAEGRSLRDAVVTVAMVLLAVAALDDITTDLATSFPLERTALLGCAVWFSVVARRLRQHGHRVLGGVSFGIVAIAALMQPWVGQGVAPTSLAYLAYFTTLGALAWFLVLAGVLVAFACHPRHRLAS